jgi:hypothetical protein
MNERRYRRGKPVAWMILIAFVLVLGWQALSTGGEHEPAAPVSVPQDQATLEERPPAILQVLRAPACLIPTAAITLVTVSVAGIAGYFRIAHALENLRLHRAEVAFREVEVEHRRQQVGDLTVNASGKTAPRVFQGDDGQWYVVNPDIGTQPVMALDEKANEDLPELRGLALLTRLVNNAGGGKGLSPDVVALMAAGGQVGSAMNTTRRLPEHVRVMTTDEAEALPGPEVN